MISTINLMLLLLGTAGALAAFGGETWKKSDEPLYKRITRRGWQRQHAKPKSFCS